MKIHFQVAVVLLLFLGVTHFVSSRPVVESGDYAEKEAAPLSVERRGNDSPPKRPPPVALDSSRHSFESEKASSSWPPPEFGVPMSPSASSNPTSPGTPSPRFTPSPPDLITFSSTEQSRHPTPARGHHRKESSGLFIHPKPITSPPKRTPPSLPGGSRQSGRLVSHSEPLPKTAIPKKPGMLKKIQNVLTGKSKPKLSKMFGSGRSPRLSKMFGSGRNSGKMDLSRSSSHRSRWSNHL